MVSLDAFRADWLEEDGGGGGESGGEGGGSDAFTLACAAVSMSLLRSLSRVGAGSATASAPAAAGGDNADEVPTSVPASLTRRVGGCCSPALCGRVGGGDCLPASSCFRRTAVPDDGGWLMDCGVAVVVPALARKKKKREGESGQKEKKREGEVAQRSKACYERIHITIPRRCSRARRREMGGELNFRASVDTQYTVVVLVF